MEMMAEINNEIQHITLHLGFRDVRFNNNVLLVVRLGIKTKSDKFYKTLLTQGQFCLLC